MGKLLRLKIDEYFSYLKMAKHAFKGVACLFLILIVILFFQSSKIVHAYGLGSEKNSQVSEILLTDWLMFHRDVKNTGYYEIEVSPPLGLIWKTKIGTSYAHPVVENETIYVGSQSGLLYAIDVETGIVKWTFDLREPNHTRRPIKSAPAIYGDIIIINSWDNVVFALNKWNGSLIWKYESLYPILYGAHSGYFINPSPTIYEGVVYIGLADGRMHAIDVETGENIWTFETKAVIKSTPAIYNGILFFGSGHGEVTHDPHLYAVDIKTGKLVWKKEVAYDVVSSPAVRDGIIYFGTANVFYALNYRNGKVIWKYTLPSGNYIESSPAISNSTVYFSGGDWGYEPPKGRLYALDLKNGKLKWHKEGYFTRISPSISGNIIYCGEYRTPSGKSKIYAIDSSDGTTLWSFETDYVVSSIPAFSSGRMFISGGDGYLYAFEQNHIIIDNSFVSDNRCDLGSTQTIGFHAKWFIDDSDATNCIIYVEDEYCRLKRISSGKNLNFTVSTFEQFGNSIIEWTTEISYSGKYSIKLIIPPKSVGGTWAIVKVPYGKSLKTLNKFYFYIKYVNSRPRFAIYLDKNGDGEIDSILLSDYLNFGNNEWIAGVGGLRWGWTEATYPPFEYGRVWKSYSYWQEKYGETTVLYVAIALEYWAVEPEGLGEPLYVDTVTINDLTYDLEPSKIIIKNLKPGQKVKLYDYLGFLKSYGEVEENKNILELDVSDLTFPFKGYFKIYSTDGVTLLYTTPVYDDIWGGDEYYVSSRMKLVTDENGWAYFKESSSYVGRRSWNVVGVDCNGVKAFKQTTPSPSIIWDRVNLRLSIDRSRVDVGSEAPIRVEGIYEYDGAPFQGSVTFNNSLTKREVGRYGYRVVSISDPLYELSAFSSNEVNVIFDRVNIRLSVDDSRIDVGEPLSYSWVGEYEYDKSRFQGRITLNDTLTKNDVGKYAFTVASISDERYGLTLFSANTVECVWDLIMIVEGGTSREITNIGKMEIVWFKAIYEFDKEPFSEEDGILYVNREPMNWSSHDKVWKYKAVRENPGSIIFEITGVDDQRYGLTAIDDKVGPLIIMWQRPFWQEPVGIILIGGVIVLTISFVISFMRRYLL